MDPSKAAKLDLVLGRLYCMGAPQAGCQTLSLISAQKNVNCTAIIYIRYMLRPCPGYMRVEMHVPRASGRASSVQVATSGCVRDVTCGSAMCGNG